MATKGTTGSRKGLIHCNNCGEDYSASYRRCPFCAEYEDEYEPVERRSAQRGGKRLAGSTRPGGGYSRVTPFQVISILISLAVILAAIWIVVTKLMPIIQRGDVGTVDPDAGPSQSQDAGSTATPVPDTSPDAGPGTGTEGSGSAGVEPDVSPSPDASPSADPGGATGFTLNKEDVTLEFEGQVWKPRVTFTPEGTAAPLTWESDNPDVVTVTADGSVTAVGLGTTTISVMMPNGVTQACIVRCRWTQEDGGGSEATPAPSAGEPSETYQVNNPDFTFYREGETFRLRVPGYTGSISWSSSDPGVATVDSDGTVTAATTGKDRCTVTGVLEDGTTVEATVRTNIPE